MLNFFENIKQNPGFIKQIVFDDILFAEYRCPLAERKMPLWSPHHYLIYVLKGRKIWHTPYGSWDLQSGDCILVKHGACIIEQFFDAEFCVMVFFIPDHFIKSTLKEYAMEDKVISSPETYTPVLTVHTNERIVSFMHSMTTYFAHISESDKPIILLKFKELLLNLINSGSNRPVWSFFARVSQRSKPSIEEIMENNFCYNLSLSEFADLCCRSVSTFKRDFKRVYNISLTKWLKERRLNYAKMLLTTSDKSVTEIQMESGFENLSHFSKCFKEHFSLSPLQFKEQKEKLTSA